MAILEPTKEGGNMGDKGEGTARDSDSLYPEGDYCPLSTKCDHEILVTKRGEPPLNDALGGGLNKTPYLQFCNNVTGSGISRLQHDNQTTMWAQPQLDMALMKRITCRLPWWRLELATTGLKPVGGNGRSKSQAGYQG